MTTAVAAVLAGIFGAVDRLVPQRRRLPAAARRVAVAPAVALPQLRGAGQALRQHPRALVAAAAGALPQLQASRSPPRYPIVEAGTGAAVRPRGGRQGRRTPTRSSGSSLVLLLVPITLIDLDHQIDPEQDHLSGLRARAWCSSPCSTPDSLVEHLIASAARRRLPVRRVVLLPAGDGHGGRQARVRARHLPRARGRARDVRRASSRARSSARSIIARMGVEEGRKAGIPFGPWLALGGVVGLLAGDEIVDWYLDSFALATALQRGVGARGVLTPPVMPQGGLRGCR